MLAAPTTAPAPAPHLVRVGTATVPAQAGPPVREPAATASPVAPLSVPEAEPAAPLLRVERGTATPEEVAALTAVLLTRAAALRAATDADATLTSRRAAARWRIQVFAGPRAWTADARDLLAG